MNLIFVCQKTRNLFIAKKLLKPVFRLAFPILTLNTSCSLLTQTSDKTFSSRENKIKSTSSIIQILCLFHNLVPCTFWHDVFQYEIVTYVFVPINWLQACNETVSSILHILHITPYYQRDLSLRFVSVRFWCSKCSDVQCSAPAGSLNSGNWSTWTLPNYFSS